MTTHEPARGAGAPTGRPASVDLAVKLILAAVACSVLGAAVSFLYLDELVRIEGDPAADGVDPDTIRLTVVVGILILVALVVVLFGVLTLFIARGANWARIVYTILGAISVLNGALTVNGSQPVVLIVLDGVQALLTIGAIVLLYRPDAHPYFGAR